MTDHEFNQKSIELIKAMINAISDKEYAKLIFSIPPEVSWADGEKTPENACLGFGEWLDEQFAMWAEDEEKEFVVDAFEEGRLEKTELIKCNVFSACYQPTSHGEELDFWFEIKLEANGDKIKATFDVNT